MTPESILTTALEEILATGKKSLLQFLSSLYASSQVRSAIKDAGGRYREALHIRFNLIKVLGMERPIPLKQIFVRVNLLQKITSRTRVSISYLDSEFQSDQEGFGKKQATYDGLDIVRYADYEIGVDLFELVSATYTAADLPKYQAEQAIDRLKNLKLNSIRGISDFHAAVNSRLKPSDPAVYPDAASIAINEAHLSRCETSPQNYIVLGKPGAGKTTFLKSIALYLLENLSEHPRFPVFLSLKDISEQESLGARNNWLLAAIQKELAISGIEFPMEVISDLLTSGRCALLLDGLDEVPNISQDAVLSAISDLARSYPKTQIIVTCRIAAYNYALVQFSDIEVADFNTEQIAAFVRSWFFDEAKTGEDCLKKINEDRQTRELATTPLLLTLLCIAYHKTFGFPRNRAELYKEAIDALLKTWDASRRIRREEIYKGLSSKRKEGLLSRVAAETFEKEEYFFPQSRLEKSIAQFLINIPGVNGDELDVDSAGVLKSIEAQHGIFVQRAVAIYSFSHLTFQEYFTARYIVDHYSHGTIHKLIDTALTDKRWREVFLLTAGLLDEADGFFKYLQSEILELTRRSGLDHLLVAIGEHLREHSIENAPKTRILTLLCVLKYYIDHAAMPDVAKAAATECYADLTKLLHMYISREPEGLELKHTLVAFHKEASLSQALEEDIRFCLMVQARELTAHKHSSNFPIFELRSLTTSSVLMIQALEADCYLSREVRSLIRESVFIFEKRKRH